MKCAIDDLVEIIDGDRGKNYPQQHEFLDNGYCLFLNTGNVTPDGFLFEANQYISEEKDNSLRKGKLQRGDIVYTTRGTVGNAAFYSDDIPYEHIRINSGMVIMRPKMGIVCTKFLYQILKSNYYRPYFKKYCTGSAQPQLPIKNLKTIELDLPDLGTQRHIASILSAYDDLIENNQKQIKLLEEAAQRLYKEWFTGPDVTKLEDVPLSKIVIFKRGTTITKDKAVKGDIPVVAGGLKPAYYHNKANTLAPVITVSGSGANAGFTRLYSEDVFASDCSFADSQSTNYLYYVYCFLKENKSQLNSLQKGSAQPHVYAKDINNMSIKSFSTQKINNFCEIVKQYFDLIGILERQCKPLTEARDRLLPKLMNGELEVK